MSTKRPISVGSQTNNRKYMIGVNIMQNQMRTETDNTSVNQKKNMISGAKNAQCDVLIGQGYIRI
jgi:hypothetical protein